MKAWIPVAVAAFAACTAQRNTTRDAQADGADAETRGVDAASAGDAATERADASDDAQVSVDARAPSLDAQVAPADAHVARDAGTGALRSSGCGATATGTSSFVTRSIDVNGTARTDRLRVPASYDASRAYPLVFRWHGAGGDGLSGGLDIEYVAGDDAIIVSGDALGGWWDLTPEGPDVRYFDAVRAEVEGELCVDRHRELSYGFSRGGGFTNLLACTRADVIRASASVAGLAAWSVDCDTPVATWFLHDTNDDAVPVGDSVAMRDRFLATNHCASTTTPTDPSPCVRYDGCLAADPVVWCQTSGVGHNPQANLAPAAVWSFFRALP